MFLFVLKSAVEHLMGGGKQQRGPFQGVRVKNSVKELLLHLRNSKQMSSDQGELKAQGGLTNYDPYTELKNILSHSRKRKSHEPLSDGPSYKRTATFQPHLLTPPQTPTSIDNNMEDAHMNEPKQDGSCDMLQSIINIKNESSPVSLNTVQVSWLHTMTNPHSPGEQYQEIAATQAFSPPEKYQAFQTSSPSQMLERPQNYQFSPTQAQELSQHYGQNPLLEYRPQSANSQSSDYQQSVYESQELPYCSASSFASQLNDSEGLDTISNPLPQVLSDGHQHTDIGSHPQTYSQLPSSMCNSLEEHGLSLAASHMPVQHQTIAGDTAQLGKSFFQFLHIAVAQGRRAVSYVLARKMAAVRMLDIKEHNGQSALQVAVAANQHLIVQDLVSLGAQVNTTDCWGRTPLHVCAEKGHAQVLQAIQKGAMISNQYVDLEATNYDGLTALHCAVVVHNSVVHDLQSQHSPHTPEVQELRLKSKRLADTIKFLIQMGASVEARDRKSGRSALHLAAEEANVELIRLFLELPTCLSFINAKAYNGNTALHVAASLQHRVTQLDAVRLLMRKGADPSARNLENEQPVHLVPDGPVGVEVDKTDFEREDNSAEIVNLLSSMSTNDLHSLSVRQP
ncbi:hypothetical protein JD844_032955 [Phrynosoma platyrhinos]|uniref:OCA domain-containing protein n=1 Tax=Phrynosoma platyrhinos TaxID=52577 RepID=A0ABQ7T6B2_PHRPL|nr:hypothetical protein JD844_032955 [Phrynosoma platyrhinos]